MAILISRYAALLLLAGPFVACTHDTAPSGTGSAPPAAPAQAPQTGTSRTEASANTDGGSPEGAGHLLVQVRRVSGSFEVVRVTRVASGLPLQRGNRRPSGWRYESSEASETPTHIGHIAPPALVRGEFLGSPEEHVAIERPGPVDFVVRVPVGTVEVRFFDMAATDSSGAPAPLGSVRLPAESP